MRDDGNPATGRRSQLVRAMHASGANAGIAMMFLRVSNRRPVVALVALLSSFAFAATDPLDEVQKSSETWLQTRLETARLESSWLTERKVLESTLRAYQERAATEEEKRDVAKAKTARDRDEMTALQSKATAAQNDVQRFDERLKALDTHLLKLRPRLPPRLSAGLDFAYRSLDNPALSTGDRTQITITVLTRCVQFDRAITCGEDVLVVDPARPARALDVIYWGLSHAYALDRRTHETWLGHPTADGWIWDAQPDAAPRIAELIAVYYGKADPDFVLVPVRLGTQVNPTGAPASR